MKTHIFKVMGGLLGLLLSACDSSAPGSPDAGEPPPFVTDFRLDPLYDVGTPIDGGVAIPLQVTAVIPGLRTGTRAYVSTSAGVVGGASPGNRATVFLASIGAQDGSVSVEGEVLLELPSGKRAWVEAQIAEFSTGILVLVPEEPADAGR